MTGRESSDAVEVVEVSPRDGLQNEPTLLSTDRKARLVTDLIGAGLRRMEVTSFVRPALVPQMADAQALVDRLGVHDGVSFIGLVLNERGLQRALASEWIDEINYVVAATDSFGHANQGVSTADALEAGARIVEQARAAGRRVSITVAVAFGCPFDREVSDRRLAEVVNRVVALVPDELALADTIGCAVPSEVGSRVAQTHSVWSGPLRLHFHDTRRTALANADAALESGVRILDASAGGIGGCPFAPGAAGNVATEDLLWLLDRTGVRTTDEIDALRVTEIGREVCADLGFASRSAVGAAGAFP